MNSKLLLIIISLITLASCSTAYKTGQTPDDVYYSPARSYDEEKNDEDKKDEDVKKDYAEERQIRMRINDPRWRNFDNEIYYSPYSYGYNYGYYYNPFYYSLPVYNTCNCNCTATVNPKNTTPRMANLGGYGNGYSNSNNTALNSKTGTYRPAPVRTYNNSNNNSGSRLGNTLNKIFNTGSSSNNSNSNQSGNSSSQSSRTYTPSSSGSSSSSSSGSSSSGSSSRPARSGKGG